MVKARIDRDKNELVLTFDLTKQQSKWKGGRCTVDKARPMNVHYLGYLYTIKGGVTKRCYREDEIHDTH